VKQHTLVCKISVQELLGTSLATVNITEGKKLEVCCEKASSSGEGKRGSIVRLLASEAIYRAKGLLLLQDGIVPNYTLSTQQERPCRSTGGSSPASHCGCTGSSLDHAIWDLCGIFGNG
jgi:hypothetical protein